ncbi:hypothetical protein [Nocardia sp. NPDC051981]|uniref:hypothetical protein n=1 Tax=Nocardia sp. NPDC051981 TaxID=3155417 RepID=UPI003449718B
MVSEEERAAIARVRAIFDDVLRYGLDPGWVREASDAAIDEMVSRQNAVAVPAAWREILRLIGDRNG